MRPPKFSDEEIIKAGNEIRNCPNTRNKRITGQALSKHLGGGKPARLIAVWEAYLSDESITPSEEFDLPEELEDGLEDILKKVDLDLRTLLSKSDVQINALANKRIEKEKAFYAEQVALLKDQIADADSVIDKNEDCINELHKEVKCLQQYKNEIFVLEKSVVELRTRLEASVNSISDKDRIIAEQEARIAELKQTA